MCIIYNNIMDNTKSRKETTAEHNNTLQAILCSTYLNPRCSARSTRKLSYKKLFIFDEIIVFTLKHALTLGTTLHTLPCMPEKRHLHLWLLIVIESKIK